MDTTTRQAHDTGYELRFNSLFQTGRSYSFPCDGRGCVDLDSLGEKMRNSYFFVRTVVGRDFSAPEVCRGHH